MTTRRYYEPAIRWGRSCFVNVLLWLCTALALSRRLYNRLAIADDVCFVLGKTHADKSCQMHVVFLIPLDLLSFGSVLDPILKSKMTHELETE